MAKNSQAIPSREALKASGLPERELLVWYVLAKNGPAHISQIAERAKLHRPAIYQQLSQLIEKGLVKERAGTGRRYYQSTGVNVLLSWCKKQQGSLAQSLAQLQKHEGPRLPEDVAVYRGKEIRKVWEELAASPKKTVFYRYDAYPASFFVDPYIPKEYIKSLQSRGLERFVITNRALRNRSYQKRFECASRVLPEAFDSYEQGISQFVYSDKIAFVDFTTETAYVIQNKVLADFQRRLFKYLYHTLPQ
jgi:sugar-specific transcriptional regulator TrmB